MTYVNRDLHAVRTACKRAELGRGRRLKGRSAAARRRRFVGAFGVGMLFVSVAIVCAAQGIAQLGGDGSRGSLSQTSYYEVVVKPGDTLWGIAAEYGDRSQDPRRIVDELRRVNGLRSASLRVGDVLRVPSTARLTDAR